MKNSLFKVGLGVLIGMMLSSGIVYAASTRKTIDVTYNSIKVYKDKVLCELKDANGTVIEPFIYNGTTYMPVRGTASLADMDVTWDGATQSVYLWDEMAADGTYLLDVCPPYSLDCFDTYNTGKTFEMAGKKYSNGIVGRNWYYGTNKVALFNLDSRYAAIECTIGHTDNDHEEKTVLFIVDGKVVKEVVLEPECLPKKVSIPVKYGLQLKIQLTGRDVGLGNITVK
ncbi:MAG: hypothetical protein IJC88_03045 [Oscillospiraceae bacterium]|nr:hypothetical protein [Oscillospiraceae bacterium]